MISSTDFAKCLHRDKFVINFNLTNFSVHSCIRDSDGKKVESRHMRLWMRDESRTESDWNTFKRSTPSSLYHHQYPTYFGTCQNQSSHLSFLKKWCPFFCLVSFDENDNGEIKKPVLSTNTLSITKDQRIKQHWIEGVFMYFVSPYIFCEGVPSLHSHTSGLSWSGPNYHSSNRPALRCPTQHCSP